MAARFYKSAAHRDLAVASRADHMRGGFGVSIDAREIDKLRQALADAGMGYKRRETVLAQSLNRAGQRAGTKLKRAIQQWTGIRRQGEITKRIKPVIATPGKMSAGVTVGGRHFRITAADFGARWNRKWAGGRHSAWSRSQTAKGSFMIFGGGSSHGGGILFHRTSKARMPIKPLWGPHAVKEMRRHEAECTAILAGEARWFMGECTRRADAELKRVKAKYGL